MGTSRSVAHTNEVIRKLNSLRTEAQKVKLRKAEGVKETPRPNILLEGRLIGFNPYR